MKKTVIKFSGVSKKFKKGRKLLLKEALLDIFKPASTESFWALRDIDLDINKGETVGFIGPNGSGKSTLLKLIAGVMVPTQGEVNVRGRVAPLIELGAGFHPELTGRENVFLNGSIMGLSNKELRKKYPSIIDFSGLEDFIDTPIKRYSSGMYMRLGFSIAIHTEPEILLMDEILAVGDVPFQEKSIAKMNEFKKKGVTIIFVSHALDKLGQFCNRAVYLDKGQIQHDGEPKRVIDGYLKNEKR